jgi:PD-(D/E)XK nuclease superfamily
MKFRYSQIQAFIDCPMGFKRRYIDGIQDMGKSSALELGTALHLAIKSHFEGEDPIEVFKMYWGSLKDVEMKYYRHSWEMLNDLAVYKWIPNFVRLHAKKYQDIKMEETCELSYNGGHGDIEFTGTFDMCSNYDGILTMTDWKTSSKEYKKNKVDNNPQMYLYAKMYENKYGVVPSKLQYKVFRKDNGGIQTLETELTKEKLDLRLQEICNIVLTMENMIKAGNWYHTFDCFCEREKK